MQKDECRMQNGEQTPPHSSFITHHSAFDSYLDEFKSSVSNWSLVVITRLDALKPVEEMIRLMNSSDRSTLLSSSAPERIWPAPRASGEVITAAPLLAPALNWLPPSSTRPAGLLK